MRTDDDLKKLVKAWQEKLRKEEGIKFSQRDATKLALRKVLQK